MPQKDLQEFMATIVGFWNPCFKKNQTPRMQQTHQLSQLAQCTKKKHPHHWTTDQSSSKSASLRILDPAHAELFAAEIYKS